MNPISLTKTDKPFSVSSIKLYSIKNDRTSQWVGNSKLKKLDTIHFFLRKQMIDDKEAELNESSEINSKTENLAVTEEADVN